MKFEYFKRKLRERVASDGHIEGSFILRIDDNDVSTVVIVDETDIVIDDVYQFNAGDIDDFDIQWFVLEK